MPKKSDRILPGDLEDAKERVRWAINYVITVNNLSNEKLAKELEFNVGVISSYRVKKTLPGIDFFLRFTNKYSFSIDWFLHGEGEPFPGARQRYPEACGMEMPPIYDKDNMPTPAAETYKINIEEAMGKTYKVLSSGTAYAVALYMNVQSFSSAVDAAKELHTCQDRITNLESQVNALSRQVDRLSSSPTTAVQQEVG